MRRLVAAALVLSAAWGAVGQDDAPEGWWDTRWRCRKLVQTPGGGKPAVVAFSTAGLMKKDGSDLRIRDMTGRETPYRIIACEFEDFCTVVWPVERGQTAFHFYYGNKLASAPSYSWAPKRGLVLEVRTHPGGPCNNWGQVQALLKKAKEVQGRALHPCVFDGHNRFGPSDNYLSIYTGWIACPRDGRYKFATTSDDASFLLVNGKMVVQWPGVHGAVGDARHNGTADLGAGVHQFAYYHVETTGDQVAEAAWQPPGQSEYSVIPYTAFPVFAQGYVAGYEQRDDPEPLDFIFWQESSLPVASGLLSAVQFRIEFPKSVRMEKPEWDFGDGITTTRRAPSHVYGKPGLYHVTLSLDDRRLTQMVRVWDNEKIGQPDVPALVEAYAGILDDYEFEKLREEALLPVADFAFEHGLAALEVRALTVLRDRPVAHKSVAAGQRLIDYAERLRKANQPQEALELLDRVALRHANKEVAWQALERQGKLLVALGMPDAAGEVFEQLKQRASHDETSKAAALRGLGDVARQRGKPEAAREHYAAAQALTAGEDAALRSGAYAQAVVSYLQAGANEAALEHAQDWEAATPLAKLDGYLSVLKAIALLRLGEAGLARAELEDLLAACPECNYASQAVLLLGDYYALTGDFERSRAEYERLGEQYPESPVRPVAEKRIAHPPISVTHLEFPILDF